ncbi:PREDICTED: 3-ketoacyl-CoA synthase 7-like [Camelina sativa]|uniref:3-ketoacyl-CoA synthase n=1 Tax=Camelina sativa TaxID=90675 RepID=A0ABM0WHF2_CAMSA|nr:PREDICTED: 3-ketoacyl-CoA synthase 7-like [Camelina sativa]
MESSFPFINQALLITDQPFMTFHHFLVASACVLIAIFGYYFFKPRCIIYLIDFSCYQPPDFLRAPVSNFIEHLTISGVFDQESLDLQQKVLERSGISDDASVPASVHEIPPNASLPAAREETHEILFTIVEELFSKHEIDPKSIDILVSNCSLFCPSPSITSMIINRFGMRSDIKSFSLSGMGCSAGILSVNLVKDLMMIHGDSLALVLSLEAVSPNGYRGKSKSMLIANTIFRMGGAAILLSNRKQDINKAKYKLQHLIRTHFGSENESYESVMQQVDEEGKVGVALSKQLVRVASKALKINVVELGPRVLPYSEQLKYIISFIQRKWGMHKEIYTPNFKKAFEHFCIHAGGRAIIEGVEKHLKLDKKDVEASRSTLYRYGNTSSSSLWYELQYLEAKGRMKKGDKVWQIGFGSGFKANSAVWKCISEIDSRDRNAWSDRIHLYPVCGDASSELRTELLS